MRFAGRTVVVTGASAGLGQALAIALAGEGATLLLSARREAALRATAARCAGRAQICPADLGSPEHCVQLAAQARQQFNGKLDYLLACMGQRCWQPLAGHNDPQQLSQLTISNYLGTVWTLQQLLPMLQDGLICAISSIQGRIPVPEHAGYCAAKHALDAYLQVLRMESNVPVLIIRPGWIDTAASAAPGKVSTQHCVTAILNAMLQRRRELYIPARYRCLPLLHLLLPRLFERVLQRRIRHEARRRRKDAAAPGPPWSG